MKRQISIKPIMNKLKDIFASSKNSENMLKSQIKATDWVEVPDISNTGTAIVDSSTMSLTLPDESIYDLVIQVERTYRKISGDGSCQTWIQVYGNHFQDSVSNDSYANDYYTGQIMNNSSDLITDQTIIKPAIIQKIGGLYSDSQIIRIGIKVKGTQANTEWEMTNIRARLAYQTVKQ